MDSRRGKSRGKSNRPLKRSLRRAVAWLLVFCMCMANMNSAAFAAEIATASNALMAATPSDAKATDSDAMEILMPEEVISGEDLATEAARAISEGNEFDFDSEIQVKKDDQGKDEGYEELFKGRRSFVLFADNGNGGRIQGDNPNAYGYILVQVDEKDYKAFEEEAGAAKATNSNATDSDAAERSWTLTGDEELVFLYINADDGSVTFTLNIENLQADDIVVPSYSELREEQKAEEEESKEESEANNPATLPADDGSENGGSAGGSGSGSAGSSDSAGDMEEIEDADKPDGSSDGQGSESGTDGGSEDSTDGAGQGSEDAGNSDSSDGAEDADKPRMIPMTARTAVRMQETAQRTEMVPSQVPVPTQVPVILTAEKQRDPAMREARNRMIPETARNQTPETVPIQETVLIKETSETQIRETPEREIPIRETAAAVLPTREALTKETPAPIREAPTRETAVPPTKEAAAPTRAEALTQRSCQNPAMMSLLLWARIQTQSLRATNSAMTSASTSGRR